MFVFCVSVVVLFQLVSRRTKRRVIGKSLEIGGIGSMVYAFLVVTPMHDLLVGIALLFFFQATLAALTWRILRVAWHFLVGSDVERRTRPNSLTIRIPL